MLFAEIMIRYHVYIGILSFGGVCNALGIIRFISPEDPTFTAAAFYLAASTLGLLLSFVGWVVSLPVDPRELP